MTIEDAIKHAEEMAKEQEELYRLCPTSELGMFHCDGTKDCKALKNGKDKGCQKCAAEHRQLAEWLKELKAHREAWMKVVSEVDQHTEIHSDGEFYIKNFDVKKIVAEYRPKDGDNE